MWAGDYIFHRFVINISYCFSPTLPCLQSKPPPTFQTVNSEEGLWIIFPQGTKKTEQVKSKVILIWHHPQALVKTNSDFCPQNSHTPGCLIQSNITHSLHVLHGNITKNSRKQTILNQNSISTPRYNTHPPLTASFHQKYLTCFETSSNTNQYFLTSWKLVCSWRRGGQEQEHFFPLGTKLHFSCKFFEKEFLLYWPPTWPPCHVVGENYSFWTVWNKSTIGTVNS